MLLVYTPRCPCLASTGSDVLVVLRVLVLVIIMLPPVGKRKFSVASIEGESKTASKLSNGTVLNDFE